MVQVKRNSDRHITAPTVLNFKRELSMNIFQTFPL